jgi:PTH1 family peptidyl-tRNA hydrolase
LGNPGPKYAKNRHNLGFRAVDVLATRFGAGFSRRGQALAAAARIGVGPGGVPGPRAVLAKPQDFMNRSGGPVADLADYFGVDLEQIVVIHDDLDLRPGAVRLKRGGGEGGHNGLRDISAALGSRDYLRVRLGIGRPPGRMDASKWVLSDFPSAQFASTTLLAHQGADAAQQVVLEGLAATQLAFHSPPESAETDREGTDAPQGGEAE